VLNSPVWRGPSQYAFCLGLILGGLASALSLLVVGSIVRVAAPSLVLIVVVLAWFGVIVVREFGLVRFKLPQNARLVPQSVFRHGRFFGPLQFGLEMGTGVRTYVTSGLPYAALVLVLLIAEPAGAVAAGVAFGLGRSLMITSNLRYSDDNSWDFAWSDHERVIRMLLVASFAVSLWVVLA